MRRTLLLHVPGAVPQGLAVAWLTAVTFSCATAVWRLLGSVEPSLISACTQEALGHCPAPAGVPAAVRRLAWETLQGKQIPSFVSQHT